MKKSCHTCKHWEIDEARSPAGRVMPDRVAPCRYPLPPLPDSMPHEAKHIQLRYMTKNYGENCRTWEQRTGMRKVK